MFQCPIVPLNLKCLWSSTRHGKLYLYSLIIHFLISECKLLNRIDIRAWPRVLIVSLIKELGRHWPMYEHEVQILSRWLSIPSLEGCIPNNTPMMHPVTGHEDMHQSMHPSNERILIISSLRTKTPLILFEIMLILIPCSTSQSRGVHNECWVLVNQSLTMCFPWYHNTNPTHTNL